MYKHHGTTQPSYRPGRRRVLFSRDERTLVRKVQINPRTMAKDLVKMLGETSTKVSISTVKRVLYRHNRKGRSARKKPLLQTTIKQPDYGLQLHMGTKIVLFGEMSSGLMKQK
uniref:Transposase Tc1-like domain-containing protein n=1 Tax=Oncorhynchus tshawytscha TaxID=74940 RepID=A0AAZ3Q8U0_ONCTS